MLSSAPPQKLSEAKKPSLIHVTDDLKRLFGSQANLLILSEGTQKIAQYQAENHQANPDFSHDLETISVAGKTVKSSKSAHPETSLPNFF